MKPGCICTWNVTKREGETIFDLVSDPNCPACYPCECKAEYPHYFGRNPECPRHRERRTDVDELDPA